MSKSGMQWKGIHRPKLNVAVVGDIDAGKSTLCARLLIQFGVFTHNDIQQSANDAKINGRNSYQYSFLLDRASKERNYVHTIDCHIHQFRVARRRPNVDFTLIDTPGSRYVCCTHTFYYSQKCNTKEKTVNML